MRKKSSAVTPSKSPPPSSSKKNSSASPHKQLINDTYFCHFKTGMYMGGIKAFQKMGSGILLHDSGACVLTSYHYDMKNGHNVVFMDNCVMSIEYTKNKVSECVIRVPNSLLLLHYNKQQQLDGKCILLDYQSRTIYYTMFRKNLMIQKSVEKQYPIINKVFDLNNIDSLLGPTHSKVLKYEFNRTKHIKSFNSNQKISVGFSNNNFFNGLAFSFNTKSNGSHLNDQFSIKITERGFYLNQQLTGMGEKIFKNGNEYIGDFKADVFEGIGLLKNTLKNNWVHGRFQSGNMVELLDYNNSGDTKKFAKILEKMHERKSSWINREIDVADPNFFLKEMDLILSGTPKNQMRNLQERKQQVLKKIQQNFICQGTESNSSTDRNLYKFYTDNEDLEEEAKQNEENNKRQQQIKDKSIFDIHQYSQQFISSPHMKKDSFGISSLPQHQSPQTKYEYFSDSAQVFSSSSQNYNQSSPSSKNYRHLKIEEMPKSSQTPINLLKLHEVQTTKDQFSYSPFKKYQVEMTSASKLDKQIGRRKMRLFQDRPDYSPARSKYSQASAIEKEPETKLDSKRMIGKSRMFKYLGDDNENESPPRFNYQPAS